MKTKKPIDIYRTTVNIVTQLFLTMHFLTMEGLPAPIERALRASVFEYSVARKKFLKKLEGQYDYEFSVTDLMQAPKQLWLKRKFRDDLVIDLVKDNYHSLLGTVVHSILEKYAPANAIVEERQHVILQVDGHRVLIHGQPDYFNPETGELVDYKFTGGFSVLYDKSEYEFQLNVNAYLFRNRGLEVKSINNTYLFRSLDKMAMARNPDYPRENIRVKPFVPWKHSEVEKKIRFYVSRLLAHKDTPWKKLPDCTNEERWIRDTRFAVTTMFKGKKGDAPRWNKTAKASFDTKKEAADFAATVDGATKIDERSGAPRRCEDFCPVVAWCPQRQAELKAMQKKYTTA